MRPRSIAISALIVLAFLGAHAADPVDSCAELAARVAARPQDGDARNRLGWCRYRAGEFDRAVEIFEEQLRHLPTDPDAACGAGYARLQQGDVKAATERFRQVLRTHPENGDARRGLSLSALRAPGDDLRFRDDADRSWPIAVPARAVSDYFELRQQDGTYAPIYVKGVNIGAALPGKFPTEAPREVSVYLDWLDAIADLGANTVRAYTLLPPEFYRALATHNQLASARRLWLIQGIWAELPDDNEFGDPDYVKEFEDEIARILDAVHGDLVAAPRPGHASGIYDTDASGSLLALILGREWEPFAVRAFDERYPDRTGWQGTYFSVVGGRAMEAWVAQRCDFAASYELKRYRMLHPLAFANWPTLDPLRHESESSRDEENAWKSKYGLPFPEAYSEPPWDNDAVSLDATKIQASVPMPAGFFAAYHVYPNYPDFLNQDTRFASYLADLKRYHGRQPLLVAEYGISSSRGVAHVNPEGVNHGGHDERAQGQLIAELTNAIHESGCAGSILFEFMDEWFKGTWSVNPLELPPDRRRLWFNAESPEQSYGVMAARPATPIRVDGDPSDWIGAKPATASRGARGWSVVRDVRVTSDEGYLYVLIRTEGGSPGPDWKTTSLRLAIDSYDPMRGVTELPEPGRATIATGAEFLVDLDGPGVSGIKVVEPYEPYAALDTGPIASPETPSQESASFVPLTMETNRERIGRDGTRYPAIRVDRGTLRFGSLDPESPDFDTRTDVAVGAKTGTIELRIPWALLNVTDPSSRQVVHQTTAHDPPLETITSEGIRIYAFAVDPQHPGRKPASRLPPAGKIAPLYAWETWQTPRYRLEPKAGVARIRAAFGALADPAAAPSPASGDARAH